MRLGNSPCSKQSCQVESLKNKDAKKLSLTSQFFRCISHKSHMKQSNFFQEELCFYLCTFGFSNIVDMSNTYNRGLENVRKCFLLCIPLFVPI